jgi:hypothetical protein
MGFFHYFGNCLKRAILYQFLIFFAIFRLNKAYRFYRDFQNKLSDLVSSLHLNSSILDKQPRNKELVYKCYLISLIVISSFSILGFKFFQFFSGILCILTGLIYHNPIRHFTELLAKNEKLTIEKLQEYFPSMEFIIFFSIGLAMLAHSFKTEDKYIDFESDVNNKEDKIDNQTKEKIE